MKFLRRFLDNLHPKFAKGGKFEKFYPLYEGLDTFLYTPGEVTENASHVRDGIDLKRMMSMVIVALIPCIAMALWNTGYQANLSLSNMALEDAVANQGWRGWLMQAMQIPFNPESFLSNVVLGGLYFLPVYIVTMAVGGIWEVIFSIVRGHEVNEGFLVTGMLLPLTLPPAIPLWQVAVGISFGVVIGKEIFGGTGRNFLNPALTARAFLYFSWAPEMVGDVWIAVDGTSSATALTALGSAPGNVGMAAVTDLNITWWDSFIGIIPGSMGETSALACLIGAAILILSGIGSWRIMAGVVIGAMGFSTLIWGNSDTNAVFALPPYWHLVVGGFAFGTVFMATDPVSASMTETGKWFYGILIGVMTVLIRVINPAFPEGIMLAILFGNVFAPVIDYCVVQANIKRRVARNVA